MPLITPIAAVVAMREDWAIVRPLMGGTRAMRAAGKVLLPKHQVESEERYNRRISVSTLLPAYSETVGNMTDRVFAAPIQLGEDVPADLVALCDDIDLQGSDLSSWAVDWFRHGLSDGLCHVLVEHPRTDQLPVRADGVVTQADEAAAGVRPYVVTIKSEQILGWKTDGKRLTQLRYLETVEQSAGEYGVEEVLQVRVLEPGGWTVYRLGETQKTWEVVDSGATSLDRIPVVTFYSKRVGTLVAKPPLIELAHLNIKHWQSQSDQDSLMTTARVPLLFAFTDDADFELVISSGSATRMPKDGNAKYVEHTGAAINAGRDALQDLLDEMRMSGAKMLRKDQSGTKTATQAQEEASQETSPLQRMASHFADCIAQVFQLMADYKGLGEGGHVEIRGNFDADYAPETSIPALVGMANAGLISHETLFGELQRRGVLSDELDWVNELARIQTQSTSGVSLDD